MTIEITKNTTSILANSHSAPSGRPGIGDSQPPKNSTLISAHMKNTLISSPIMNSRNGVEEYSTW